MIIILLSPKSLFGRIPLLSKLERGLWKRVDAHFHHCGLCLFVCFVSKGGCSVTMILKSHVLRSQHAPLFIV